ncbi:hypothetical protein [Mesohalobacter halotolerans]|uniref:TonB-dependent receptor plug domain-containing protein n=1 Tax=Mesohalobacter halotolerans TaxID=1883405 RepID=A0A4V6ALA5_9FLAO|nr:hypothetical protein [Mesohalobacter halotolerans]TKS55885.1 hypothetical protein FCN74_07585 [Mesohalobacter halotolerans]
METSEPIEQPQLSESYQQYFEAPRESLYLHFNKSSFLKGENLWFQGYAYDRQTQKLSQKTRNVELRLYNANGRMLQKQMYLSIGGKFMGQIPIDSTFKDGNYYLKAETQWMKNFNEDYTHLQQFEVIGSEQTAQKQDVKDYDLQILPESGHSVVNCDGVLGLKLINKKGLGVRFKAKLYEDDKVIFIFKSNKFGMAKVDFKPKANKTYKIMAELPNGKTVTKFVDDIKPFGIDLKVNNILSEQTVFYISSNLENNKDYLTLDAKLFVHQEGNRFEVPLEFSSENPQISKGIKKNQLFYGVNTVTLMVNNKPVAERLIFNRKNSINKTHDVKVEITKSHADSLTMDLSLPTYNNKAHLSISVLPEKSISYVKNQNITSAFLLDPFINGYIENKPYYFRSPNRLVDYNLDLLLLTQGWSSYEWGNIFNRPPKIVYPRKDGLIQNLAINGNVPRKTNKLLIYSTIYNGEQVLEINENASFRLENRYPFVSEKMEFSFINHKKDFIRPNIIVGTEFKLDDNSLKSSELLPPISSLRQLKLKLDNKKLYANFLKGEILDEVIVKVNNDSKPEKAKYYVSNFKDNTVKVDEELATTYPLLSDYLSYRGYIVKDNGGGFSLRNLARMSLSGSNTPVVYLNGTQLNDLSILSQSRTSDYEEIYIDKTGFGGGVQGANGIIRLQQRKTVLFSNNEPAESDLPYSQFEIKKGFEPPKRFYMPEYAFFKTESFQQVGTIAWFSNVVVQKGESLELDILDTGLYKMNLYIEGIGEDGSIINVDKQISK